MHEVRESRRGDLGGVIALWDRCGLPFEPDDDRERSLGRELRIHDCSLLVVECDGDVIGTVMCTRDGRRGWINRLAVDPSFQGLGIARTLVDDAEGRLRSDGAEVLCCLVLEDNDRSRGLFEGLGYISTPNIWYYRKPGDGHSGNSVESQSLTSRTTMR